MSKYINTSLQSHITGNISLVAYPVSEDTIPPMHEDETEDSRRIQLSQWNKTEQRYHCIQITKEQATKQLQFLTQFINN